MTVQQLFLLSIFLYVVGALISLGLNRDGKIANYVSGTTAFLAGCTGVASAVPVLIEGKGFILEGMEFIPFGRFTINVDPLSAFMTLVISLLSIATGIYSISYQEEYIGKGTGVMGFLNNIFIVSMILVVTIDNAFYFLVFWELMTLVSYFLVCFEQENREAIKAGFVYFVMAHVGTVLIMISFILFYVYTGTFDFAAFRNANLLPVIKNLAFLLAFLGFGVKAGIVPFHFWLPQAHPAAPSNVSALMSGVMIKTAIYGIIRVGVDFLGASAWWWGLTVLAFGAISAVFGVLYAVSENDLKRLLAYSSIENVGIILMGVGAGMMGIATGQVSVGILGILAGLYHLINHAVFKGLLFLGAGSVVYRLHTRNMEEMGGLARYMPWTGLTFFIGALSISALPPLNGFVSKWFTYHTLFAASTKGSALIRMAFPLAAVALALTGALTSLCFVKAYGVTFTGPFRGGNELKIKEVPVTMLIGMGLLAIGCFVLGLGVPIGAGYIANVASALLHVSSPQLSDGLSIFPASSEQAMLSTLLVLVFVVGLAILPLLIIGTGGKRAGRRVDFEPWACGYKYSSRMAWTSTAFAHSLYLLFSPAYLLRTAFTKAGCFIILLFKKAMAYISQIELMWERYIYYPLLHFMVYIGKRAQTFQTGNVRMYCLYIILTLGVLLIATVR
ncbi:hydrogenase 4 subunit B [Caldanaerobacter subterraneus]|uniref:Hydrogenase subunit HyfB n=1 Tax=Caldanaerobacter subterraneus subsp. pacificus DSM 12653 TaxID=391606 RepID=B7R8Q8_9THEO|nr:hydrogenase 4 subunit B [Caldanaerobacter subterraneus]KKC29460.1 hydrogenase subunit HyfB [Caldanaerobacter subterraneus subsp. pacificus DSM 12653]